MAQALPKNPRDNQGYVIPEFIDTWCTSCGEKTKHEMTNETFPENGNPKFKCQTCGHVH